MALRVLIVDDSAATRFILRDMFEADGHTVVDETETLDGTLKSYAQHKPDVVTLDLSLADCDGISVLKALRLQDPKAKVVVISGNSQAKIRDLIFASGAAGFVEKPFRAPDITEAVTRALAS